MFKYTKIFLVLCCTNYVLGSNLLTNLLKNVTDNIMPGNIIENVAESTVFFKMFTRENPTEGIALVENNLFQVDPKRTVMFIVHGLLQNSQKLWYSELTIALLRRYDCTVIQTDWGFLAVIEYTPVFKNVKMVGNKIGKTIQMLNEQYGVPLSNFWILGHSLGSHVAGFAGQIVTELTGGKIEKIINFDAGALFFENPPAPENQRLSSDDAEVVVNIHTDGGGLGFKSPIGIIDIFANGGSRPQPGCEGVESAQHYISSKDITDYTSLAFCSHYKSHEYYTRALNREKITMTKCDSFDDYKNGKCDNNVKIDLDADFGKGDAGLYYFTTKN